VTIEIDDTKHSKEVDTKDEHDDEYRLAGILVSVIISHGAAGLIQGLWEK